MILKFSNFVIVIVKFPLVYIISKFKFLLVETTEKAQTIMKLNNFLKVTFGSIF